MPIDYTKELNEFCAKYKIHLIGNYTNVKNITPIYYKCSHCDIQIKKSYKTLTKDKDYENIAYWIGLCHKCFKNTMF
jgi:hypothetical protein